LPHLGLRSKRPSAFLQHTIFDLMTTVAGPALWNWGWQSGVIGPLYTTFYSTSIPNPSLPKYTH